MHSTGAHGWVGLGNIPDYREQQMEAEALYRARQNEDQPSLPPEAALFLGLALYLAVEGSGW